MRTQHNLSGSGAPRATARIGIVSIRIKERLAMTRLDIAGTWPVEGTAQRRRLGSASRAFLPNEAAAEEAPLRRGKGGDTRTRLQKPEAHATQHDGDSHYRFRLSLKSAEGIVR